MLSCFSERGAPRTREVTSILQDYRTKKHRTRSEPWHLLSPPKWPNPVHLDFLETLAIGPSPCFSSTPICTASPQMVTWTGMARNRVGISHQGPQGSTPVTRAPSVSQNRKLGWVGVPGQCLSQLQWDSVLNLRPQLPFLTSSSSSSLDDISSLHRACRQLNLRPDVGGTLRTSSPNQLLRAAGLPRSLARAQAHFLTPVLQNEVLMAMWQIASPRD